MFGAGATGFFAMPYGSLAYPLLFVGFPRLWSVARRHGYITAADFVRGRFGSKSLALAVAVTGIAATIPYIALQLFGLQVVIAALGIQSLPGFWRFPICPADRLRGAGALHLFQRIAWHRPDRDREGRSDLFDRDRGGDGDPHRAWRLCQDFRQHRSQNAASGAAATRTIWARASPIRRWRWARCWRCSSIPTP